MIIKTIIARSLRKNYRVVVNKSTCKKRLNPVPVFDYSLRMKSVFDRLADDMHDDIKMHMCKYPMMFMSLSVTTSEGHETIYFLDDEESDNTPCSEN
jgi:hypothetical protein